MFAVGPWWLTTPTILNWCSELNWKKSSGLNVTFVWTFLVLLPSNSYLFSWTSRYSGALMRDIVLVAGFNLHSPFWSQSLSCGQHHEHFISSSSARWSEITLESVTGPVIGRANFNVRKVSSVPSGRFPHFSHAPFPPVLNCFSVLDLPSQPSQPISFLRVVFSAIRKSAASSCSLWSK